MKTVLTTVIALAVAVAVAVTITTPASAQFWRSDPTTDETVSQDLATMLAEAERQVPLPAISNWTERRAVQWLYELRDDPNFTTYSYLFVPMTGEFVLLCNSIGFGINASIQFANPERVVDDGDAHGNGYGYLPQAEPNGLFMPEGLAATYIMCVNEDTETIEPMYVEPEIIVTPFPMPDNLVVNQE